MDYKARAIPGKINWPRCDDFNTGKVFCPGSFERGLHIYRLEFKIKKRGEADDGY